ncbi:hypothetical protein HA075_04215 [bacterium BFN5]|nr:hypothetical protein HA075_04215 [bacterium BFN5]
MICCRLSIAKTPSVADTQRLISSLKPVLVTETSKTSQKRRFKEELRDSCADNKIPVILQLAGLQTSLLKPWFILGTIAILVVGTSLSSLFGSDAKRFLVSAAPLLGLLTFYYECRAQFYQVSELEAACCYSASQLALARILVIVGYNISLFFIASLCIDTAIHQVLWQYIMSWLAPLVFILGVALFTSLQFGITGGCLAAGMVWLVEITLLNGNTGFIILYPSLSLMSSNLISVIFGTGLIGFSVMKWKLQ